MTNRSELGTLPELRGPRVTLRAAQPGRIERLAREIADGTSTARWWSPDHDVVARWLSEPDYHVYEILFGERGVGVLAFEVQPDPDYRYASMDIAIFDDHQSHGIGPEALRTLARWLADEHGYRRFHIDPAAENERAVRAYEKAGFKRVGILREYERAPDGTFRDGLLMDLLAEEIPSEPGTDGDRVPARNANVTSLGYDALHEK